MYTDIPEFHLLSPTALILNDLHLFVSSYMTKKGSDDVKTKGAVQKPRIPKVTLKVINQDRMFFADFLVNCQPIFMKFCNNHISTES